MQTAAEPTSEPIRGANLWVRAAAHVVDLCILLFVTMLCLIPLVIRVVNSGEMPVIPGWVEMLSNVLPVIAVVIMWRYLQATPGKMMFKLKIVDSRTGERPSWGKLWIRCFSYLAAAAPFIPFKYVLGLNQDLRYTMPKEYVDYLERWYVVIPLGLGFLWILIDKRNRGWHDLLSGTVTISAKD